MSEQTERTDLPLNPLRLPWQRGGTLIANCDDDLVATADTKREATAIVRAINSHDALVALVKEFQAFGCPICLGDCGSANPPMSCCPMQSARALLAHVSEGDGT